MLFNVNSGIRFDPKAATVRTQTGEWVRVIEVGAGRPDSRGSQEPFEKRPTQGCFLGGACHPRCSVVKSAQGQGHPGALGLAVGAPGRGGWGHAAGRLQASCLCLQNDRRPEEDCWAAGSSSLWPLA